MPWFEPHLPEIRTSRANTFVRLAQRRERGRDRTIRSAKTSRCFLTGGSSLVPTVRRIFETRFCRKRVVAGGELVSVGEGRAVMGRDQSVGPAIEAAAP